MNYNKIIIVLIAILIAMAIVGTFLIGYNHPTENKEIIINNTTTEDSSNEVVEQISTDEEVAQSGSSESSSTHTIMGEDGYYYVVDDDGNNLQTLGPSERYYPNGDPMTGQSSVDYPDAEPSYKYIDKSK